jgi:uncharacterized membrane protein YphA (DoxX/SURF4 family)
MGQTLPTYSVTGSYANTTVKKLTRRFIIEFTINSSGRNLFGGYFLFSAFNHFSNYSMTAGYVRSKGVPASTLMVAGTGPLPAIDGISVVLNIFPLTSSLALVLFLVPVTLLMHTFCTVQESSTNGYLYAATVRLMPSAYEVGLKLNACSNFVESKRYSNSF